MTKYKTQKLKNTFANAKKGVQLVLKSERNIRIHLIVAAAIILAGILFDFSTTKICILLLTISSVICAEMVNSALEFSLDAVFHNKYSRLVGMAKDIAAGAVMFTSIIAGLIGLILFLPPIFKMFFD